MEIPNKLSREFLFQYGQIRPMETGSGMDAGFSSYRPGSKWVNRQALHINGKRKQLPATAYSKLLKDKHQKTDTMSKQVNAVVER